MKSPFEIFRRHQRMAMVVLVFMAMFAFVVLDSVQQMPELPAPVMAFALGALLAGVFWFLGSPKGQAKEYALLGGIIGVAAGFIGQQINQPPAAVETRFGRITYKDLQRQVRSRQQVNQFFHAASERLTAEYLKLHPEALGLPPQFLPFQLLRNEAVVHPRSYFGLLRHTDFNGNESGRPLEEDVALADVFRHEADRLGVVVSQEMVTQYIQEATYNQLSRSDFYDVLQRIGLTDTELYGLVASELKAQMAFNMLSPRPVPTPEQLWEYYRKLHVREALDLTAIPVSAFAAEGSNPSEGELELFFTPYATRPPTNEVTPEPAFGHPRRVKIAWIEADFKTAAAAVTPVLDMEIAAAANAGKPSPIEEYYEKNKDLLYLNRDLPSDVKLPDRNSGPTLKAPDFPGLPGLGKKPDGDSKPAPGKKPDDAPPDGKAKPDPGAKPDAKPEPQDKPDKKPDTDKEPDSSGTDDGDSVEEELDEAADDQPAVDAPKESKKPPEPATAESNAEKTDADKSATEKPDEPAGKASDAAVAEIPGEPLPPDVSAPPPKYRPLDLALREEIRNDLIKERADKRLQEWAVAAEDQVRKLANEYYIPVDRKTGQAKITPEQIAERLRTWATQNGYRYSQTEDFVTQSELMSEDYPVGQATESGAGDPFQRRTVAQLVFESRPEQRYIAAAASDLPGNHSVYWKVDDVPPRAATLSDPGMREKVIEAWKLQQAREPAKKRAEAVADLLRKAGGKDLVETLAGQTVTGKPDGQQLTVRDTEVFSWVRQSAASPSNPFAGRPPPELSTISSVDKAGNEFFEAVFDELKDGEVGVAPNADHSVYYVVKVKDRVPATDAGEDEMRKQFLARPDELFAQSSPYMHLMQQDFQTVTYRWLNEIDREYAIDWSGLRSRQRE